MEGKDPLGILTNKDPLGILNQEAEKKNPLPSSSDGSSLESTESPSVSAPRSTSRIKQNNAKKIDIGNSSIVRDAMKSAFANNPSVVYQDTFINKLTEKGYDKGKLLEYAKTLKSTPDEALRLGAQQQIVNDQELTAEEKSQKELGFTPLSEDKNSLSYKTTKTIGSYLENAAMGVEEGIKQAVKGKIQADLGGDPLTGYLNVAAGTAKAGFSGASLVVPEVAAIAGTIHLIKELPDDYKASAVDAFSLPSPGDSVKSTEEKAKEFDTVIDLPFAAASIVAEKLGYAPEEGSRGKAVLELLDILPATLAGMGKEVKIKNSSELLSAIDKIKNGEASELELKDYADFSRELQGITLEDVRIEAERQGKTEIVDKIDELPVNNNELHKKAAELESKIESPEIQNLPNDNPIKQGLINDRESVLSQIIEQNKQEVSSQLEEADYNAKISDIDSKIAEAESSLEGQSESVKESIQNTINNLKKERDAIQESSAGGVFQYSQEGIRETGGERGGVESVEQRAEATENIPEEAEKIRFSNEKEKFVNDEIEKLKVDEEADFNESLRPFYEEYFGNKFDNLKQNESGFVKESPIEQKYENRTTDQIEKLEPTIQVKESEAEIADSFTEQELEQKILEIDSIIESEISPNEVGISEAARKKQREELGLPDLKELNKNLSEHKFEYLNKEANRLVESKEVDFKRLADDVIEGKAVTDDLGKAILLRGATEVGNNIKSARAEIDLAKSLGDKETEIKAQDKFIEAIADLDRIQTALEIEGTAAGRNLAAMKQRMRDDYSIGGLYTKFKEANGNKPLPKEIVERLDNYAIKIEELNARIKDQEEKLKKQGIDIENLHKLKPTTKEKIKQVREKRSKLFEEWKESRSKNNDVVKQGLPIGDQDVKFAAKIALSYLEEGYYTTQQVSNKLKREVKEALGIKLSDQDIYEILDSEVDGKKVIDSFENDGIGKSPLADMVKKAQKGIKDISEKKESKGLSEEEKIKRNALTRGSQKVLNDLKLEKGRTKRKIDNEERALAFVNKTKGEKFKEGLINVMGVPRSLMASFDFSAPLRQGLIATAAHPITAAKAIPEMFKQAFSKQKFEDWLIEYKSSPEYKLADESGLYIADPSKIGLEGKEEAFMSNLAEKIPGVGIGIAASERGYVAYLNKMRADVFKNGAELLKEQGKSFEKNPEDFKAWADFVNNSTGRGKLPTEKLEKAAPVLNALFFSPRLIASRLNLLNPYYYYKMPAKVRVMALTDMAKFAGLAATIITLAELNGAKVEKDPRSSDFLKIKDGDTRFDILGGFQQYIVLASRLATLKEKTTTKRPKLNSINPFDKKHKKTPADVVGKFFRNKLSPSTGIILDVASGKKSTGAKVELKDEIYSHFTPLQLQEGLESYDRGGIDEVLKTMIPSMFGVGVQTYSSEKNLEVAKKNLEDELKRLGY